MSASFQPESRDRILNRFHEISGLSLADCVPFLEQYHWNLEDIVNDFYNKKEFKTNVTHHSNEKQVSQQTPTQNANLGNFYTKRNQEHKAVDDDDGYIAELLTRYGDADESARSHWRNGQQTQSREGQQTQSRQGQQTQSREGQQYHQAQPQSHANTKTEEIYHEKQEFLRCGIHSLNNLFQIPHLFTHEHLDGIVRKFDKRVVNNDYGKLWIGDYDLRILIEAINQLGYPVRQINFFNGQPLHTLPWDSYFGLLINLNGAHWFTIKNLNGIYHNLDSTFSRPSKIGTKDALVNYLIHLIEKFQNVYIFTVLQQTHRS